MEEPFAEIDLEQSIIFNDIDSFGSEAMRQKQLKSFRFANTAFDIYIPISHHEMSVLELKKSKGYYWASAAHFLLGSKAHGFPMWKQLQEQINSDNETIQCHLHLSNNIKRRIFTGLDKVASEYTDKEYGAFLLNDWVLIQLPFQPALLHRWLSAVLLTLYNFEKVYMTPFYSYLIPRKYHSKVQHIYAMLLSTHNATASLFDVLQDNTKDNLEIYIEDLKGGSFYLSKIIDFLKFVSNEEKLTLLRHIVDQVSQNWDPKRYRGCYPLRRKSLALKRRSSIHNVSFWSQPRGNLKMFGHFQEKVEEDLILMDQAVFPDITKENFKTRFWDLCVKDEWKQIFNIELVEQTMEPFEKILTSLNYSSHWERSLKSIKKKDCGLLTKILHSKAAVAHAKSVQNTYRYLCSTYKMQPDDLFSDVKGNLIEPEFIEIALNSFNIAEYNWSFGKTLKDLKESIGTPNKTCPNVTEEPRAIALKFEARIKKIVIDQIISHHEMTNFNLQKDTMMRDWQVVQYLLPCFVVSYLDLCESPIPPTEEQKEWYLRFIHELISSYELYGIRKSSKRNIVTDCMAYPMLEDSIKPDGGDQLLQNIRRIAESFLQMLKGENDAFIHIKERCLNFFIFYEVLFWRNKSDAPADLAKKPCIYWNWLMMEFFKSMDTAIRNSRIV